MSSAQKTNAAGLALVKRFEGLRLAAYPDPASPRAKHKRATGVDDASLSGAPWTIGYGHTGDVQPGDTITEHQADVILRHDMEDSESEVTVLCPDATPNQFSALVSFVFNLGGSALKGSTLRRKYLAGDVQGAADEFPKWCHAGGEVMPGLVTRRAAERDLFLKAA